MHTNTHRPVSIMKHHKNELCASSVFPHTHMFLTILCCVINIIRQIIISVV